MVKTKVILIRHAEAEGNYKRLFQGHFDADVSDKGLKQLDLLAIRCRNMQAKCIYTSSLKRAYRTAEAVNTFHNLPMIVDNGLIEINGGAWENTPWKSLPELYPEQAFNWNHAPWDFAPLNGEPMTSVYDRAYSTLTDIIKKHRGETVFVVSHGCAIRNMLCRIRFDDIKCLNKIQWCDNTALSIIEFDDDMNAEFIQYNDASHLDKETSTLANQVWYQPDVSEEDRWK